MRRKLILLNSVLLLLGAVVLTAQAPPPALSSNAQKISDGCVGMGGPQAVCDHDAILHELTMAGEIAYHKVVSAQFTADEAKEAVDVLNLTNQLKAIPASALPAGPNFTVPACSFSGISGNIATIVEPSLDPAGSPCDVGWTVANERVIYTFYVPAAGNYQIITRTASGIGATDTPGGFHFEVNGQKLFSFNAPITGGWQTWQAVSSSTPIPLPAGIVSFTVVIDHAGSNFEQMVFIKQ